MRRGTNFQGTKVLGRLGLSSGGQMTGGTNELQPK